MKTLNLNIPDGSSLWHDFELRNENEYQYYSDNIAMSVLIRGPKDGQISLTKDTIYTCREEAISDDIRARITKDDKKMKKWFGKARILLYTSASPSTSDSNITNNIEAGVKTVQIIEKCFGWPLTKIYKLNNREIAGVHHFYYVEGCRRWIKAPAMISLYLLLIRLGKNIKTDKPLTNLKKKKSLSGLIKYWKAKRGNNDLSRFREIAPHLKKLLENYQELFGYRDFNDLYRPKAKCGDGSYILNEGIQKLIKGYTVDAVLRNDWRKTK